jgi:hypothetical protein
VDHLAQFRLPQQDQLQKLVLVRIDVGEHPQLLEPFDREVLCLVDHQRHRAAFGILRDDEILQELELRHVGSGGVAFHIERVEHPLQQLAAIAMGVGDQPDDRVVVEILQELLQQRRFAGAHLTGDHGDRRPAHDAVFQHGKARLCAAGPIQEIGVRQKREGAFGQPEMPRNIQN